MNKEIFKSEVMCDTCSHRDVCRLRNDFEKTYEEFKNKHNIVPDNLKNSIYAEIICKKYSNQNNVFLRNLFNNDLLDDINKRTCCGFDVDDIKED